MSEEKAVVTEEKSDKVQVCANKEKYVKTRTSAGKTSLHCGDAVAEAFAGLAISQKYALASKITGIDRAELEEKYKHLNVGMQGMSLANRTRGALNKDAKLETPTGLMEKMQKIVAPLQAEAKIEADKATKIKAEAKAKADDEKKVKAEAKAKAEAEKKAA